jgi:hypothetical protein
VSFDPYSFDGDEIRWKIRHEFALGMAATDPRAQMVVTNITDLPRDLVRVVRDPALRWARSWREFAGQLRDIIRHEFWVAQGRPERSPGAEWVPAEVVVNR